MPTAEAEKRYRVIWTEISHHEGEYTAEQLALMAGCSMEEFVENPDEYTADLGDGLAEVSDEAFDGLTREVDEIELLNSDDEEGDDRP